MTIYIILINIVIKYFFRNKKIIFGVIANKISFKIFPEILFYDYNSDSQKIKSLIETFDKIDIIEYHYFIKQLPS
jgi:hypothetical protein